MLLKYICLCFLALSGFSALAQIRLFSDFENGNGMLVSQNPARNELSILPQIKNRDKEWLWFHAKVSGFRKDTLLTIHLPFYRASYAPDPMLVKIEGQWQRIAAENHLFFKSYRFAANTDTLTLASGVPYSYSQLLDFLKSMPQAPFLKKEILCLSEGGQQVPMLRFRPLNHKPKGTLFFQARQHAFEAPSSYFMQGLVKELLDHFGDKEFVLGQYQILVVPMVDVDNVRDGAYGKDQFPVDFNRDWVEKPHWKAVLAIQNLLLTMEKEAPVVFTLDCHAPHPITKSYSHYYLALADSATQTQNLKKLMAIHQKGEGYKMISQRNNRIKPGECNFNLWVHQADAEKKPRFPRLLAGTTYEQSWQEKPDGSPYTPEEVESSGRNFIQSLAAFFLGPEKIR